MKQNQDNYNYTTAYTPQTIQHHIHSEYQDISYSDLKQLRKYLSNTNNTNIKYFKIRDIIQNENDIDNKGYFILKGSVTLTKMLKSRTNKDRNNVVTITELSYPQIINIQSGLYDDQKVKYTSIVSSSQLICLVLPREYLMIFYELMKTPIQQLEFARKKQINIKQKSYIIKKQQEQNKKMISKLQLPELKIAFRNKTPVVSVSAKKYSQVNQTPSNLLNTKKSKSQSLQRLHNVNNIKQSPTNSHTNIIARNQKIFREQLKSIIKRKLIYQRKQLGVLKAFRRQDNIGLNNGRDNVIYSEDRYTEGDVNTRHITDNNIKNSHKSHENRGQKVAKSGQIDTYFLY